MNDCDALTELLKATWAKKSLDELRLEAESAKTGIVIEAIARVGDRRCIMIVCVTGIDQISLVASGLGLEDNALSKARSSSLTVGSLITAVLQEEEKTHLFLIDEDKRRNALVLIAADPRSITNLEHLFCIPTP